MKSLPQPVVTVNNKPVDAPYSYWAYSETTNIIDVSDAAELLKANGAAVRPPDVASRWRSAGVRS